MKCLVSVIALYAHMVCVKTTLGMHSLRLCVRHMHALRNTLHTYGRSSTRSSCTCYCSLCILTEASVAAGKLKELGNTVLGKFGMSLDNFKAEKDPNTGSYSINFKQ